MFLTWNQQPPLQSKHVIKWPEIFECHVDSPLKTKDSRGCYFFVRMEYNFIDINLSFKVTNSEIQINTANLRKNANYCIDFLILTKQLIPETHKV